LKLALGGLVQGERAGGALPSGQAMYLVSVYVHPFPPSLLPLAPLLLSSLGFFVGFEALSVLV
jgi:hypothetical protein